MPCAQMQDGASISSLCSRKKKVPSDAVATVFEFWRDFFTAACQGSAYDNVRFGL